MRQTNIQHGQRRRMPLSVRVPVFLIILLSGVLVWMIATFFGGA